MKGESSRLRKDPKRRAKINAGWRDYYQRRMAKLAADPRAMRKYTARASKLLAETWNQVSLDDCIPGTDLTYKEALPDDVMHF